MTTGVSQTGQPEVVYCAAHPDVETGLTCGRCGTPICPRCLVYTPGGTRCRDCARLNRLPTFDVRPVHYARAVGVAVVVALALGAVWGILPMRGYGNFLAAAAVGFLAGEAISRAVNRKRSLWLRVIAGATVPAALIVSQQVLLLRQVYAAGLTFNVETLFTIIPAVIMAALTSPFMLLALALGIYIAVVRVGQ